MALSHTWSLIAQLSLEHMLTSKIMQGCFWVSLPDSGVPASLGVASSVQWLWLIGCHPAFCCLMWSSSTTENLLFLEFTPLVCFQAHRFPQSSLSFSFPKFRDQTPFHWLVVLFLTVPWESTRCTPRQMKGSQTAPNLREQSGLCQLGSMLYGLCALALVH